MGDGRVLEFGTHRELLAKDGAYVRLVHAQQLKEKAKNVNKEDASEDDDDAEIGMYYNEGMPLHRPSTTRSAVSRRSSQLDKRITEGGGHEAGEGYTIFYLFKRMSILAKDQWRKYAAGTVAALSEYIEINACIHLTLPLSDRCCVSRGWGGVCKGYRRVLEANKC